MMHFYQGKTNLCSRNHPVVILKVGCPSIVSVFYSWTFPIVQRRAPCYAVLPWLSQERPKNRFYSTDFLVLIILALAVRMTTVY